MLKVLKSNGNFSGGSAELCVPLKGDCCASGCAITPLGDGAICETCWSNPTTYYTGPVDHDATDLKALAQFWTAAEAHDRAAMRSLWPQFRGRVPNQLAAKIIDDIEASRRGNACS